MPVPASVSFAIFVAVKELTFLEDLKVPPASLLVDAHGAAHARREPPLPSRSLHLPAFPSPGSAASWMIMLVYAVPVGVACALVALVGLLFVGVGKRLGQLTHGAFSRLGGRCLGLLLTPVVGGVILGLLAKGVLVEDCVQQSQAWALRVGNIGILGQDMHAPTSCSLFQTVAYDMSMPST